VVAINLKSFHVAETNVKAFFGIKKKLFKIIPDRGVRFF